jgi:hypothetical protein
MRYPGRHYPVIKPERGILIPNFLLKMSENGINVNWLLTAKGTTQITQDFGGWIKRDWKKSSM